MQIRHLRVMRRRTTRGLAGDCAVLALAPDKNKTMTQHNTHVPEPKKKNTTNQVNLMAAPFWGTATLTRRAAWRAAERTFRLSSAHGHAPPGPADVAQAVYPCAMTSSVNAHYATIMLQCKSNQKRGRGRSSKRGSQERIRKGGRVTCVVSAAVLGGSSVPLIIGGQ